jgi:tetratricopeptide (TPR) repeat protein
MTGSVRNFLIGFAAAIFLLGGTVVGLNLVIDPFWRWDLVTIPGVNGQRTQPLARLAKAQIMCRDRPTSVIMGTSRAEVGLDPGHPGWRRFPGRTYNLALAGSGLKELELTLRHAVYASPDLRHVVMALDFLMFNAHREAVVFGTEVKDFDPTRLLGSRSDSCWRTLLYDSDKLLGMRGLLFDLAAIRSQMPETARHDPAKVSNWIALYDQNGFRGNNFESVGDLLVKAGRSADQEAYYALKIWRPPPDRRYCFTRPGQPDTMLVFRDIVRFAREAGIDIRFVINPIHARMSVALQEIGLWPQYEDWKRGVVAVLAEDARQNHAEPFPLWDFSGFNSVTMEAISKSADRRFWWEPSHYRKAAGDLMLDRVLDYKPHLAAVNADFGILLWSANIDAWLSATRMRGRAYRRDQPDETQIVIDGVLPILATAGGTNCGSDIDALREAGAALRRHDTVAAEEGFARAVAIHEADLRRAAELGVPYREVGFAQALRDVRAGKEISRNLGNWEAYQARGNARFAQGDFNGAVDDFTQAIELGPLNTALYFLRGSALLRLADYEKATTDFKAALELEPSNIALKQMWGQARAGALQREADAARAQGDLARAIRLYDEAIKLSPPNTALYYQRGSARLELGELAAAAEDFEAGLKIDPSNVPLQQLVGRTRIGLGSSEGAHQQVVNFTQADELRRNADLLRAHGDLPGAIDLYSEAIKVGPTDAASYYLRGVTRLRIGELTAAIGDFKAGLSLDPTNVPLQLLLHQARTKLDQGDLAAWPALDPARAAELQREADALRAQGDLAGAIRLYGETMLISPPNTALYYLRGTARLETDELAGAAEDFEDGLLLDPNNPTLRRLLRQARTVTVRRSG